ncbi:24950_t:CDS:2 [Gigaspora margarita]|uniref:24950_t:CDS:1 n=1 Tax=Gigaspora margarita TaxID=4874 RepID=A0ABN7W316_GIGMA|nr:24950_t:CDS:2 [Gigaspora margarita]
MLFIDFTRLYLKLQEDSDFIFKPICRIAVMIEKEHEYIDQELSTNVLSFNFTSELLNIDMKNATIHQKILDANNIINIRSFSQYMKHRIQKLETMLDNLDNNLTSNISASRYVKENQNYTRKIETLEKEACEYNKKIDSFEKDEGKYIKKIKKLNQEINDLKSRLEQESFDNLLNKIKGIEVKIESKTSLLSEKIKNIELLLDEASRIIVLLSAQIQNIKLNYELNDEIHELKKLFHNNSIKISENFTYEIHELTSDLQNHNYVINILLELAIDEKNNNPIAHESNHIKFAKQIGNLLQNYTPFYAEISERWAVINDIVYFFGTNKGVKALNDDAIEIDIIDLFDAAICFKKDLNSSFYDRYVIINLPNLKNIYSDEIIYAMQKILQAIQTILLIFGPYGRGCLLYLKQHKEFSSFIPTFKEILDFSIEAKRYFSMYILHHFFMNELNFEEGELTKLD